MRQFRLEGVLFTAPGTSVTTLMSLSVKSHAYYGHDAATTHASSRWQSWRRADQWASRAESRAYSTALFRRIESFPDAQIRRFCGDDVCYARFHRNLRRWKVYCAEASKERPQPHQ
jgi:hypothetical protein